MQDLFVGVTDEEIDEVISRAKVSAASPAGQKSLPPSSESTLSRTRALVLKAEAMNDEDVAKIRLFSDRDRARILHFAQHVDGSVPWNGELSSRALVLPPKDDGEAMAVPVTALRGSGSQAIWQWFAATALRLSRDYRVQPVFAFGFLLIDSYWHPSPEVSALAVQNGENPRDAKILLEFSPFASDSEIIEAVRAANGELSHNWGAVKQRQPHQKTVALANRIAQQLAERKISPQTIDWKAAVLEWNLYCEEQGRQRWMYSKSSVSSRPEHQFARDVKHALNAVLGQNTLLKLGRKRGW